MSCTLNCSNAPPEMTLTAYSVSSSLSKRAIEFDTGDFVTANVPSKSKAIIRRFTTHRHQ
jgi:hypothetical protein